MRRTAIVLIAAAALLGACSVNRGYEAKPVAGKDDPREVSVPDIGDHESREAQDCFMIEIWAGGWTSDAEDEGIACMVEDDR